MKIRFIHFIALHERMVRGGIHCAMAVLVFASFWPAFDHITTVATLVFSLLSDGAMRWVRVI